MPAGGLSVDLLVMELPRTWVAEARHKACFYQRLHNDSCSDGPCRHRWSNLYTRLVRMRIRGCYVRPQLSPTAVSATAQLRNAGSA